MFLYQHSKQVLLLVLLPVLFLLLLFLGFRREKRVEYISPIVAISSPAVNLTPSSMPTPLPKLTFDDLFSQSLKRLPDEAVTLIITGDIIPARSVNRIMRQKNDFLFPFRQTASYLRSADITLINLEAPLIEGCPTTDQGMIFCGDPRFVKGLTFAGVDVANLANNHSTNYGKVGLEQTKEILLANGISPVGLGNILYLTVKGTKFAFLGFNGVVPFDKNIDNISEDLLTSKIKKAATEADLVIVSFHWGKEYVSFPQQAEGVAPFDPRHIAHLAVKAGADVVVGNHPHWYQGIEIYQGKIIFYALGNFIFDQFWSQETKEGFVAKLYFYRQELLAVDIRPIYIDGIQPVFLQDNLRKEFLIKLKELSKILISGQNMLGY